MLTGACLSDIILRSVDADVLQYLSAVLEGGKGVYLSDSVQILLTLSSHAENPLVFFVCLFVCLFVFEGEKDVFWLKCIFHTRQLFFLRHSKFLQESSQA